VRLNTTYAWVNLVVHKLIPIVLVVDWLLEPAGHRLRLWIAAAWLTYPAAWFAYTLLRNADTGWYPYPLVDVDAHGYGRVFANAAILLVAFTAASLVFVLVGNWRARSAGEGPTLIPSSAHPHP
jgi:hypothetical protein